MTFNFTVNDLFFLGTTWSIAIPMPTYSAQGDCKSMSSLSNFPNPNKDNFNFVAVLSNLGKWVLTPVRASLEE